MSLKAKVPVYLICSRQVYSTTSDSFSGGRETALLGGPTGATLRLVFLFSSPLSLAPHARWGVCTWLGAHTPMWVLALPFAGFVSRAGVHLSQHSFLSTKMGGAVPLLVVFLSVFFSFSLLLFFTPLVLFQKSGCGWILAEIGTWCIAFHSHPSGPRRARVADGRGLAVWRRRAVEKKWASPAPETRVAVVMLICRLIAWLVLEVW